MKLATPKFLVATESEYAAHLAGMNTFFGAVLGFVMAGTEKLDTIEFSLLLVFVSGIVVCILYVSAGRTKLAYGLMTLFLILVLPNTMGPFLEAGERLPEKLQATLVVWTLLTLIVEYLPRRPDEDLPAKDA